MAIPDDHINTWKINYGLGQRSPEEAFRWWHERNGGMAPAGAVAALGLCIEEIERIKAENDRAAEEAFKLCISYKNKIERLKARLDDGCAEALRLRAEVERLRALCRRQNTDMTPEQYADWLTEIDAAGRGEGTR